ncbi:zinc-binding alcohol dehydrogenase family protein [Planctomicrobium sp. SH668]|uniref:zinc-binding alcohol dehydrogenase family protein n=1 Tax=Planctomicrobium sp. SH668 TaxID=3448126 RepID=UPI003F5B5A89
MRAIRLEEPKRFVEIEVPHPGAPLAGHALVRTHRMGICGTDISGYLGKMPFFAYPRIPGHELGVEVLAVGEGVSNVSVGDRCSVEPYMNCGDCFACRRGQGNCCAKLNVIGVMIDGGLCEEFHIRADKLHASKKLNYDQLALVETLAIGCHATDRGAPEKGTHTLIIGAGPIGLSVLEFTRLTGTTVTVMDMNAERLKFCRETYGIEHTIQYRGDGSEIEQMNTITNGDRYLVVTDATGSNRSMSGALRYVSQTGRLVYVGITTAEVSFLHPQLHKPEVSILGSRNAMPSDFTRIIRLIEEGTIDTAPWITHRIDYAEFTHSFEAFTKPETGAIKALVNVSGE